MNAPIPTAPTRQRRVIMLPPILTVRMNWTEACEQFKEEMLDVRDGKQEILTPGSCVVALLDLVTPHERIVGDAALGGEIDADHLIARLREINAKKINRYSGYNAKRLEVLIESIDTYAQPVKA